MKISFLLVLATLLSACGMKVITDTNPEASFQYSTFEMCLSPEQESIPGVYNTLENRAEVERNVIREMKELGMEMVIEGADVLVNYHISSEQERHLITNCTNDDGSGFWPSCRVEEFAFTQGTLSIHIVDNETGGVVWIGNAEGILDGIEPDNIQELIEKAVQKIFDEYPKHPTTI